jgi:hypothetical protein
MGYDGVVVPAPGSPQGPTSQQATTALQMFFDDPAVTAFYGFSGGGHNLKHILAVLASKKPEALHRIDLIVVIGATDEDDTGRPFSPESVFTPDFYNATVRKTVPKWEYVNWELVYITNPTKREMSVYLPGVPKDVGTHMFGPDLLLAQTRGGIYQLNCGFFDD